MSLNDLFEPLGVVLDEDERLGVLDTINWLLDYILTGAPSKSKFISRVYHLDIPEVVKLAIISEVFDNITKKVMQDMNRKMDNLNKRVEIVELCPIEIARAEMHQSEPEQVDTELGYCPHCKSYFHATESCNCR